MTDRPFTQESDQPIRLDSHPSAHVEGRCRFTDDDLAKIAARDGIEAAWVAAFERHGAQAPTKAAGDFAVAVRDRAGRTLLAVDRFAIRTLCYRVDGNVVDFHARADVVANGRSEWDPQAIFDYLYFHVIPAPRTIYRGVQRLPAGHCALVDRERVEVGPWWRPLFVENRHPPFEELRERFRSLLRDAVERQLGNGRVGCFLSGGTDSSTIAGLIGQISSTPRPPSRSASTRKGTTRWSTRASRRDIFIPITSTTSRRRISSKAFQR